MVRGLYAIIDQPTASERGVSVGDLAAAYLEGGARLLQVRAPGAAGGDYLAWCDEVVRQATPLGAKVFVNDRPDIALMSGAAGVHLGQTDLPPPAARQLLPPPLQIGLSTHTRSEVDAAAGLPIDYVAVGPVFATTTKASQHAPVGLELVRYAAARHPSRPVVAIGGMTLDRARGVLDAGAAAVAVIGDLLIDDRPDRRVADYVRVCSDRV